MEFREFFSERKKAMKYIANFSDGMRIQDIYLVKTKNLAVTKNGKEYLNVTLQDRTGTVDAKIWEPNSPGIHDFSAFDYVYVEGNVTVYNGANQVNIQRLSLAEKGAYDPADFYPVSSRDPEKMKEELSKWIDSVQEPHLKELLNRIFRKDQEFYQKFVLHSAAKTVHHGFVGGLLEHTLSVTAVCDFFARHYGDLNRDLLITAALCHDIGKVRELTAFPRNDYSDEGQLIGHIVIGYEMILRVAEEIPGFPPILLRELCHCVLSHHGELEYGSPKKPALMEAMALSFADNVDAKLETMREALSSASVSGRANDNNGWTGFNKLIDSNIRRTSMAPTQSQQQK